MEMKLEIFVKDVAKSLEFYQNQFGFTLKGEPNGDYIALVNGNTRIALNSIADLSENHYFRPGVSEQRLGLGCEIVLETDSIEGLFEKIKDHVTIESELKEQSWGKTDFRVIDPDGYYLRITSSD